MDEMKVELRPHITHEFVAVKEEISSAFYEEHETYRIKTEPKLENVDVIDNQVTCKHEDVGKSFLFVTPDRTFKDDMCNAVVKEELKDEITTDEDDAFLNNVHQSADAWDDRQECVGVPDTVDKETSLTEQHENHTAHLCDKPYKCKVCDKSFPYKSHLVMHTRTHTGDKPFTCEACNKSFSQKSHLVCHTRTHTGDKPYRCTVCHKSFVRNYNLVDHAYTHTENKPFQCKLCNKNFARRRTLVNHVRTHTGDESVLLQNT